MDLFKAMESYVRVVRAGGFASAAKQLGVSRAIVSKHIKDLEAHMGARLLHRTTRRLSPTEIGLKHYEFCTQLLRQVEVEQEEVSQLQDEPRGIIKIAAAKSFGNAYLATMLADFAALHDQINIAMMMKDEQAGLLNLVENGCDLAIHLQEIGDSTLVARQIGTVSKFLVSAPDYLAKAGAPQTPQDLRSHSCLVHLQHVPAGQWTIMKGNKRHCVKVAGRFAATSALSLRSAALRGLGIAALPAYYILDDLASGDLVKVLPDYRLLDQPVCVLYPDQRRMPYKVRLLVDFLSDQFGDVKWDSQSWPR